MHTTIDCAASCAERCRPLIRETLAHLAPKWSVPILLALSGAPGPLRYAALRRALGGITPKELAKHLRQLEAAGLVERRVHPTAPPQVDYAVTPRGRTLFPSLAYLAEWAARFGDAANSDGASDDAIGEASRDTHHASVCATAAPPSRDGRMSKRGATPRHETGC